MKRVVITGANKGIGLAIVKRLLKDYPDVYVYLGSRDAGRGQAAVEQVLAECSSAKDRLELLQIDVTVDASVQQAAQSIKKSLGSDLLYGVVNNAGGGIADTKPRDVLDLNMYGVKRVTEAFLPLVQNKGRIVQVSSGAAPTSTGKCREDIQALLSNKQDVTWEEVETSVIQPMLKIAEDSSLSKEEKSSAMAEKGLGDAPGLGDAGFHVYGLSKACVNTYTFILSKRHPNIIMNCCSPGFIETDLTVPFTKMSGKSAAEMGMLSVDKGTVAPVFLLMDDLEFSGRYYGSDAKRSPMHKYRSPGDPEYDGAFP